VLDSFRGHAFFGLDEMHLWGLNISKSLWNTATDSNSSNDNPLFIRADYRRKIGSAMKAAMGFTHRNALDGQFLGNIKHMDHNT
jgi:hypothetical protein